MHLHSHVLRPALEAHHTTVFGPVPVDVPSGANPRGTASPRASRRQARAHPLTHHLLLGTHGVQNVARRRTPGWIEAVPLTARGWVTRGTESGRHWLDAGATLNFTDVTGSMMNLAVTGLPDLHFCGKGHGAGKGKYGNQEERNRHVKTGPHFVSLCAGIEWGSSWFGWSFQWKAGSGLW